MSRQESEPLLGAEVVQLLLPHRRPMLMVDGIDSVSLSDPEELRAHKLVSANEAVFDGHFPDAPIWPGALTVEGLAQTCLLLSLLVSVGGDGLRTLVGLHRSYRATPGTPPVNLSDARDLLGSPGRRLGLVAAVELRLVAPVYAGQRVDYHVVRTHLLDDVGRFDVEATVRGKSVIRGSITAKV
jgi:3-hydroxyacyl-[acyl-carrier-protein] dehydratase